MSDQVKGVIESLKDDGGKKGRFGVQHRVSLSINGEWYSGFFNKSAESLRLAEGKLVKFDVVEKNGYKNIDTKSLQVSTSAPVSVAARPGGSGNSTIEGATVGNALNNAVLMAIAMGDTSPANIHRLAGIIVTVGQKVRAGELEPAVEAPAASSAKPKPATRAKPKPSPEPEPDEGFDDGPEGEDEPAFDDDFGDDIPF